MWCLRDVREICGLGLIKFGCGGLSHEEPRGKEEGQCNGVCSRSSRAHGNCNPNLTKVACPHGN